MTERTTRRQALKLAGAGAVAGGAVLAGPGGAAAAGDRGLVGSWNLTITATDPPLGSFHGLITFVSDGTVVEARRLYIPETPFGPILETPGHGAWERLGSREFAVFFRFLIQGAPDNAAARGVELGTDNVKWQPTLDRRTDTLSGPFESKVKDTAGNVIFTARGTVTGTRIAVERL